MAEKLKFVKKIKVHMGRIQKHRAGLCIFLIKNSHNLSRFKREGKN